jgi:predicted ATP-grasp superfamily ATP-dependent carboligase
MIVFKSNNIVDISDSKLLLSSGLTGFVGIIATKLFITKYGFEHIGTYFSEYMQCSVTVLPDGVQLNGEVYYSKERKISIILFTTGIPKTFRIEFFSELDNFIESNKIKDVVILSGIIPDLQTDSEIKSSKITPYYFSNCNDFSEKIQLTGGISINKLFQSLSISTKQLHELTYLSGIGFAKYYIRYQNLTNKKYNLLASYIRSPVDVLAGLALFNTLCSYYGLTTNYNLIDKKAYENFEESFKSLNFEDDWMKLINSE